jgi:hypothetical protein
VVVVVVVVMMMMMMMKTMKINIKIMVKQKEIDQIYTNQQTRREVHILGLHGVILCSA